MEIDLDKAAEDLHHLIDDRNADRWPKRYSQPDGVPAAVPANTASTAWRVGNERTNMFAADGFGLGNPPGGAALHCRTASLNNRE